MDEVAIAGRDGKRAVSLLSAAKRDGSEIMRKLAGDAIRRVLADPDPATVPVLFTDDELQQIADALSSTQAAADLLGRARVHRMAEQARTGKFAEPLDPFDKFVEPVPLFTHTAAIDYFKRLVPTLGVVSERYGPRLDRQAFTLAAAADEVLLAKVKSAIADYLGGGRSPYPAGDIDDLLDAAGVGPRNSQYSEMVFRTNMMDAYNQGTTAELQSPAMVDEFPVWQYLGIDDERAGDDHRPKFDRYYPSSAAFAAVRGPRVFNCRCSQAPIHRAEWHELQRSGAAAEDRW